MTALTPAIMDAFKEMKVFSLATASKSGVPNVAPMGSVFLIDEETIWIGDNFMSKTLANVLENPKAAIFIYGPGIVGCYQIKADVTVKTSGEEHAKLKAMIQEKKPNLSVKSILILKVSEVFDCMPREGAGKRLL